MNQDIFRQAMLPDYDLIQSLPSLDTNPSPDELKIANTIFKTKCVATNMKTDLKELFLIGVLFIVFSSQQMDNLILRFAPSVKNFPYSVIVIKLVVLLLLFWIIKNYGLSKV